jgi:hypothetical protein
MLDFFVGFVAGSLTCYLFYAPVKPISIWIELAHLGNFLVVTHKDAPTNDRQAAGGSEAKPEEGTCQMETDVSSSAEEGNARSSETEETVLSWSAQLFEPIGTYAQ